MENKQNEFIKELVKKGELGIPEQKLKEQGFIEDKPLSEMSAEELLGAVTDDDLDIDLKNVVEETTQEINTIIEEAIEENPVKSFHDRLDDIEEGMAQISQVLLSLHKHLEKNEAPVTPFFPMELETEKIIVDNQEHYEDLVRELTLLGIKLKVNK